MTYQEKLKKVVYKLKEERELTRKGLKTLVSFDDRSFTKVGIDSISKILLQLQDDEKILKIVEALQPIETVPTEQIISPSNDDHYEGVEFISVKLDKKFDDWYEQYLIKEKSRIENISNENFQKIFDTLLLIEDQLQITQSNKLTIDFVSSFRDVEGYEQADINDLIDHYTQALSYLKNIEVVQSFSSQQNSLNSSIIINISFFNETMDKAKNRKKNEKLPAKKITVITHAPVKYDHQKGILTINGKKVVLKKDSFRARLLKILLTNDKSAKKEWSWDEVIEEIEGIKDTVTLKENKKKFYPACDGLSKHIASKTGINDLLIFNKSTVHIDPKYL